MYHQLKNLVRNNQNNIVLGKLYIGLNNNYICPNCRIHLNQSKNNYSLPFVKKNIQQQRY